MKALILALLWAAALPGEAPPRIPAPLYTPSSIVNAANYKAGPLAPNTIGTIYGRDLAFSERSLDSSDLYNGTLPTTLLGSGVRVLINRTLAYIYFVSPTQINFLVPSTLKPGKVEIQMSRDSLYGEPVRMELAEFSPALFLLDPETVLATHGADGSVVTNEKPAEPGEVIILWATGLGTTRPRLPPGQISTGIAWLENRAEFQVIINSKAVEPANILYAGAAPGFAGLYQINFRVPENAPRNPELKIGIKGTISPSEARLPLLSGNQ